MRYHPWRTADLIVKIMRINGNGAKHGTNSKTAEFPAFSQSISICVDEIRNGELSGRLYHCYSEEACPFSNVAHLIELAENLFDQIKFPQASTQMRTFTDKSRKTVQPPEKKKSAEELEKERGKKGTMLLYVQYRQRSTWQGMVKWVEGDQEWKFFSELELFKIINQAIQ